MLGKEIFSFSGRGGSSRAELRLLVLANRKAAAAVLSEQRRELVNEPENSSNTVLNMRSGWKRFDTPRVSLNSTRSSAGERSFGTPATAFDPVDLKRANQLR